MSRYALAHSFAHSYQLILNTYLRNIPLTHPKKSLRFLHHMGNEGFVFVIICVAKTTHPITKLN